MHRLIILITAFMLSLTLQAQTQLGIDALQKAIKTFLASNDLLVKDTHWSHNQEQWSFKYVCTGDSMPTPATLATLQDAFAQNVRYATSCFFHNPADGPMPFSILRFIRSDSFYSNITGTARLNDDDHLLLLNFTDDGGLTSYHLLWRATTFPDRNGKPFTTIDGYVCRYYGGIWRMEKFMQEDPWELGKDNVNRPITDDDLPKFETLKAQLTFLSDTYHAQKGKGNEKGCDATVYLLKKVCDGFDGQLTLQQFDDVNKAVISMLEQNEPIERTRVVNQAADVLWRRVVSDLPMTQMTLEVVNDGKFLLPDDQRMMVERYDDDIKERPEVKVMLTGQTSEKCRTVRVQRRHPEMKPLAMTVDDGHFSFAMPFMENLLIEVSDDQGNSMVLFTDSVPVEIDLQQMTLRGSRLNERFADCQRRLRALEPERHKYMQIDGSDITVMDEAGSRQLAADAHRLQMDFIRENNDNLIPVWYIAENYTMMSHEELAPCMQPAVTYSRHEALQPAKAYYEGLLKRLPGQMFADVACVDTAGISHRLSEYIGCGDYVVLQFWEEISWVAHSGCKYMKQMAKDYRGKNLRVVGLSLDYSKKRWKDYVRKRALRYEHLSVPEGSYVWESEVVKAYGIRSLPETIVFDPEGRIISIGLGGESLIKYVSTLPLKQKLSE